VNFDIGFDVAVILCGFYTISRSRVLRRGPPILCQGRGGGLPCCWCSMWPCDIVLDVKD